MTIKACIFDLDGVVTDLFKHQYQTWRWVCEEIDLELSHKQFEKLNHLDPKEALEKATKWANVRISEAEKQRLLQERKTRYLASIDEMSSEEITSGFTDFNKQLQSAGIQTVLGSPSINAIRIIDKLDLVLAFNAVVDGNMVDSSNAYDNIVKLSAEKLGLETSELALISADTDQLSSLKDTSCAVIGFGTKKPKDSRIWHIPEFNTSQSNALLLKMQGVQES